MARAHVVAFSTQWATVRLFYDTKRDARRAVRGVYGSCWSTLLGMIATYEGRKRVPRKVKKKRAKPTLQLEPVEIIDLFNHEFPGYDAARRLT